VTRVIAKYVILICVDALSISLSLAALLARLSQLLHLYPQLPVRGQYGCVTATGYGIGLWDSLRVGYSGRKNWRKEVVCAAYVYIETSVP
jgi:hypothetical protein